MADILGVLTFQPHILNFLVYSHRWLVTSIVDKFSLLERNMPLLSELVIILDIMGMYWFSGLEVCLGQTSHPTSLYSVLWFSFDPHE